MPATPLAMGSPAIRTTTLGAAAAQSFGEVSAAGADARVAVPGRTVALPLRPRRRRSARWLVAGMGLAVIIPVAIIGVRALQGGDRDSGDGDVPVVPVAGAPTAPPRMEPPKSQAPAMPARPQAVPATVDITIETVPPGALITVNGRPRGPSPVTLPFQEGTPLAILADREGYRSAEAQRTASAAERLVKLQLAPENAAEPVRPKAKPPSRPGKGEPSKPVDRPFDPNAPGGV
jgi:hypothetical protein